MPPEFFSRNASACKALHEKKKLERTLKKKTQIKLPELLLTVNLLASTNNRVNDYTLFQLFRLGMKNHIFYNARQSNDSSGNISRVKLLKQGQTVSWPQTNSSLECLPLTYCYVPHLYDYIQLIRLM